MKIYLIRHAKTKDDEKELVQRHKTSIMVDSKTMERVKQVKKQIGKVDFVYCSNIKRAKETASLIFDKQKYKILDFIGEYKTPKEIIGRSRKYAIDFWQVKHKKDKMNIFWKPNGGESFMSMTQRVEKFYEFLIREKKNKKYKKVAIVGHGTFFRYFLLRVADVPYFKYPQLIFDVLRKLQWENLQIIEVDI